MLTRVDNLAVTTTRQTGTAALVADPPGFARGLARADTIADAAAETKTPSPANRELVMKKVWETAKAPFKSLAMTGFMVWMSGGGVHIFSILITAMALRTPLQGMLATGRTFRRFEAKVGPGDLLFPKLVYFLINLGGLAAAMYKCAGMGLLPTGASDWVGYAAWPKNR